MIGIKLAIHCAPDDFSARWIEYCNEHEIPFKIVDCTSSTIINDLADVQCLLWNWGKVPVDYLVAKQLLSVVQLMGIVVFPDWNTSWHFDDKVAQKYLLESIGAPLVSSHVFYDKKTVYEWLKNVEFPTVFKLRGGAGSLNVYLVHNIQQAKNLCNTAFGRGFKPIAGYFSDYKTKLEKSKSSGGLLQKLRRLPSALKKIALSNRMLPIQRGYAYFQEYMPDNVYDTRITIIGSRAFGFRRLVRPGDFRASGSGRIDYTPEKIDKECISIAFETVSKLRTQSLAFDFVYDQNRKPRIIEISYSFVADAVYKCPGYWDMHMQWRQGHVWPQDAIIEDLLSKCKAEQCDTVEDIIPNCNDKPF